MALFNPSRDQVREFFTQAWHKRKKGEILSALETMAADLIEQHPEYHADIEHPDAVHQDYTVESGRTNPFLHLSMHLAIQEQVSVDHPKGIREAWNRLCQTHDPHEASHIIMEALGEVVWEAQRLGQPLDDARYLERIRHHASRH